MTITTKRIAPGYFEVLNNGQKTEWKIINGDLGCSGRGGNTYGIALSGATPKWIGSLAKCKKTVELNIKKGIQK